MMAERQEATTLIDWWLRPIAWLFARRPAWRESFGRVMLRLGDRFYVLLALAFVIAGAWDQFVRPFDRQFARASFDWLMSHRPRAYLADPNIVVLDIDEASLAAMAPEFGRWPWPRRVLADVGSALEAGGAQAVMYDILFADPDIANPASEAAFDRYVRASRSSYFPIVRLNPKNDAASEITLAMLNFAQPDPAVPAAQRDSQHTVALLPPYFKSIYDSTRTGTNNITPDEDNVVRWYPNYEAIAGYRIPALPYRMAQVLAWPLPAQPQSLLNWPQGATPYRAVGFAAAYRAASRHDTQFFAQFQGKVVLVGSTAISLNDIRATPVARLHPGIDLLATAIDNTKNARFLHPLQPIWLWVLEILMLAASARLFWRRHRATAVAKYFFLVPGALLAVSLLSISVSDRLLDLSVPAGLVLLYFTIAKLYESQTHDFIAGTGVFALKPAETERAQLEVACLPATVSRAEVLHLLMQPGPPVKLWAPLNTGLGNSWMEQGWVLWRWRPSAAAVAPTTDAPAGLASLTWHAVLAMEPSAQPFVLARVIAAAAANFDSHRSSSPMRSAEKL
jgi:CHASE2 domain-containing sensor protein